VLTYNEQHLYVSLFQVSSHEQAEAGGWWDKVPPLMSNVLNSAIASVDVMLSASKTSTLTEDSSHTIHARGYAVGGAAGGQVQRVEASADRGRTWEDARIVYREGRWSWVVWEATLDVKIPSRGNRRSRDGNEDGSAEQAKDSETETEVWCRATDESGVVQMAECDWNLRGVAYNAYGHAPCITLS
jgi:sulfite oxidase